MPSWVLVCGSCGLKFTHSPINDRVLTDFFLPAKPQFASGGAEFECPNCKDKAVYKTVDLRYQA